MQEFRRLIVMGLALLPLAVFGVTDYALSFNGVNDYVTCGPAPGLGASTFTVEAWFKRLGTGATASSGAGGVIAIPLITKGSGESDGSNVDANYFFGINAGNNVLAADFEDYATGANHPVYGVTPVTNGAWYHAAVTYDGSVWALYLNGVLETNVTVGQTPRWDSIQHAGLATALNSAGVATGFFNGLLDEVRIWNYARTAQQIAGSRNWEITAAPGLIGRWGLNEGSGSTAGDSAGGAMTGMLAGSPAWVTGFQQGPAFLAVARGDHWRYFKGTSFPAGWATNGYDDSAAGWATGRSGFGYGDGDDATVLSDMTNAVGGYVTVFTRKWFYVKDTSAVVGLTLGADYDDGFIAYINGTEVARRSNAGAGAISNTTLASASHEASGGTSVVSKEFIPISPAALRTGSNLLAVAGNNVAANSSDLSLIIDLTLSGSANVTRGPYLQIGTSSNLIVRWRTDALTDSQVLFGPAPTNLTAVVSDALATNEHELLLAGLTPNTRYYYSVGTTGQALAGGDGAHFFQTAPPPGTPQKTRVWALGDFGTGDGSQASVFNAYTGYIGTNYTDALLMLGDNAYDTGTDAEFTSKLFVPYRSLLRQSVTWPCVGNHETAQSTTFDPSIAYYQSFTLPTAGQAGGYHSGTERYYSFDYANIHFINLDSQTSARTNGSSMLNWLALDLSSTAQKWIIAYWHHPPYSKGSHDSDTETQLIEMRRYVLPVLEGAGVDLVLCGHSHVYERSWFLDGHYSNSASFLSSMKVDGGDGREDGAGAYQKNLNTPHGGAVYVVAGSGGQLSGTWIGGSTTLVNPTPHPAMLVSLRELGSVALEIDDGRLDAKFINGAGVVDDHFTILKGATLTVAATDELASETNAADTATFQITRAGATNTVLSVGYTLTGAASNGVDYAILAGTVTLPKGQARTNLTVTARPDSLAEGDETVHLQVAAGSTYVLGAANAATATIQDKPVDAWRFARFGLNANNPAIACDTCDPDGDGVPNLAEYAFALDPNVNSQTNLPALTVTNGCFALTYRRPHPAPADVQYIGESSSNLVTWRADTIPVAATSDNGDGTVTVTVLDRVTPGDVATPRFLRVKLLPAP